MSEERKLTLFQSRLLQVTRDSPRMNAAELACALWPDNPKVHASKQQPNHTAVGGGLRLQRPAAGFRSKMVNDGYLASRYPLWDSGSSGERRIIEHRLTYKGERALAQSCRDAEEAGLQAWHAGIGDEKNPYLEGSDEMLSWNDGWNSADDESADGAAAVPPGRL